MRYYFESQQEGRFKMLDYYKGMDISFLQEYMEKGMKTYDLDGTPTDPLELAKNMVLTQCVFASGIHLKMCRSLVDTAA